MAAHSMHPFSDPALTAASDADCVRYQLFPKAAEDCSGHLEELACEYTAKVASHLAQYIWHKDPFCLYVVDEALKRGIPPHLEGSTCFGDNIEDEWFIVFLLLQISKEDAHLVIKVDDNDGEFLLIEAADHLPKWINPETAENRVFLHKGSIHIIPRTLSPSIPSLTEALSLIRENPTATQASSKIQQAIQKRIKGYPDKIREQQHLAHCYLPASAAAILNHEPQLVSAAVQAFYLRDPIDLKACRAMKYFPPETRVMTQVRFTRCQYAQLMQQRYHPDRRTGWHIPPADSPEFKAHDLGMKLACGFEILAASVKKATTSEKDSILEAALDLNDIRWKKFLQSLKSKGFFRSEMEGSRLHTDLLNKAKSFYCDLLRSQSDGRGDSAYEAPGQRILQLLKTVEVDVEKLKEAELNLEPPDDDSWLEISPGQLDAVLNEYAKSTNVENNRNDAELGKAITGSLKAFVHHTSGLQGAEFPKQAKTKDATQQNISFDPDAFQDAVNAILDFQVPEESEHSSSSGMSDYSDEEDDQECVMKDEENAQRRASGEDKDGALSVIEDMKLYMEQMDRELAKTDVGLSFERIERKQEEGSKSAPKGEAKRPPKATEESLSDEDEVIMDDYQPVDVDLTALKNILESYSSQQGMPGPASNILSSMGIELPQNADEQQS